MPVQADDAIPLTPFSPREQQPVGVPEDDHRHNPSPRHQDVVGHLDATPDSGAHNTLRTFCSCGREQDGTRSCGSPSSCRHRHYPFDLLDQMTRTTPWSSWRNWLTSYSIGNRLMFFPPPPSYGFAADGDRVMLCATAGHPVENAARVYIPWTNIHPDGSGRVLGRSPRWMKHVHGVPNYITCTRVDFCQQRRREDASSRISFEDRNMRGVEETSATFSPLGPSSDSSLPAQFVEHRLVLCFHGNAADCSGSFVRMACNVVRDLRTPATLMLVEYPGYGNMDGDPSEAMLKCVAERVVQFVFSTSTSEFTPRCVTLLAHSMGTGVAMHVLELVTDVFASLRCKLPPEEASKYYLGGMLLIAPFSSIRSVLVPSTDAAYTHECQAERTAFEDQCVLKDVNAMFNGVAAYRSFVSGGVAFPSEGNEATHVASTAVAPRPQDEAEDGLDINPIYRWGSRIMLDRFCNFRVAHDLQRDYDCFRHTSLVLVHGVLDETIPASHSLRLCMSIAHGETARREVVGPLERSGPLDAVDPGVMVILQAYHDHNDIVGDISEVLSPHWNTIRGFPGFCPLAKSPTAFTTSALPTDLGSVRRASTTPLIFSCSSGQFLSPLQALVEHRSLEEQILRWQRWEALLSLVVGCWVIACGITHMVVCRRDRSEAPRSIPNSHAVMVWAALEGSAWLLAAWVKLVETRCSLSWRTTSGEGGPSNKARMAYYILRLIMGLIFVSVGAIFGFACAFSSSVCPSLSHSSQQDAAGAATNDQPPSLDVAFDATRWSMVAAGVWHSLQVVAFVLQHH